MTMRVKDLIAALQDMPEEAIVYLLVNDVSTGCDAVILIEPTDRITGRPGVPEVHLS
jgi:hypothetical protein